MFQESAEAADAEVPPETKNINIATKITTGALALFMKPFSLLFGAVALA
jgi:hypothetical protein